MTISPQLAWNRRNQHAMRAHRLVAQAIKAGNLSPEPCFICGAPAEAHHADYGLPLSVEWVCRKHHRRLHATGIDGDLFARGS